MAESNSGPDFPDPDSVERRLADLQTPEPVLREVLRRGHLAGDFCTDAHARTFRGLRVYHEVNAELRGDFKTRGWFFNDDDNIPRVVRPDGTVVLTAVSGNALTGIAVPGAQTRNPRGDASIRLIRQNAFQISLFDGPENDPELNAISPNARTWYLLYFRDGDMIRSELSLANGVTAEGNLLLWAERLILAPFNLYEGDGGFGVAPEPTPDVDVPVVRRSA